MEADDEILGINVVMRILGYKSRRSALRWCANNGVQILSFHGSPRKYVSLRQFEWVRTKKMVSRLFKKIPELKQKFD